MDSDLKQDCIRMAESGATAQEVTSVLVRVLELLAKASKEEPQSQTSHDVSIPQLPVSRGPTHDSTTIGHHILSVSPLSFAVPRKKLSLFVHTKAFVLSTKPEYSRMQIDEIACIIPTSSVSAILCLPTPNKPKENYTVAICFDTMDSSVFNNPALSGQQTISSPILFSFDNTGATLSVVSSNLSFAKELSKTDLKRAPIIRCLNAAEYGPLQGPKPTVMEPCLSVLQANPPGKLGVSGCSWVNGHVKMKDGHLYLLPTGVFFGFKKPIHWIPHSHLHYISFSCITSRTFNLLLHHSNHAKGQQTNEPLLEIEIEMIDKSELEGVLAYFKGRGIGVGEPAGASAVIDLDNAGSSGSRKGKERLDTSDSKLNGEQQPLDPNGQWDDEDEDDEDFVGQADSEDGHPDEEFDSDHQTDDESSSDGNSDDGDSDEDANENDEDGSDSVAAIDSDSDAEVISNQKGAANNIRKRKKSEEPAYTSNGKRRATAITVDDSDSEEDDDVDELAL
ncbi:hypothetical protein HDU81_008040 [Chytriomyces hyalinus]|nr:hypothetical protein HDU81_008040 [Chytriomyces hyalinus]